MLNTSIRISTRKFTKSDYDFLKNLKVDESKKEKLQIIADKVHGVYFDSKNENIELKDDIKNYYNILTRAIKEKRKVKINYYSYKYGNLDRIIKLYDMFLYNTGWGCAAYCELRSDLRHYLLDSKECKKDRVINLTYKNIDKEKSFISLAVTVIPCAVMLNYYLPVYKKNLIIDYLDSYKFNFDINCDAYEIFTGIDSSTASKYLESTMVESGIGIPIIHDKYSYCYGRSTTSINNNNIAIYLDTHNELDKLLLQELPKYYKDVVVINVSENSLLGEYDALIQSMYLTKYIAESKNKDLSLVDYSPIVKKLYYFKGNV